MIERRFIGYRTPEFDVEVEKGRLRQFARAIGETDPVYLDERAARAAGHASLPVPPTFLFCLEMERDDPYDRFATLGIPLGRVLHGEQRFVYHRIAADGARCVRVAVTVSDQDGQDKSSGSAVIALP